MTALGSFSSGDVLTAAQLNAIGTWDDWSPTVYQNGTVTAGVTAARYSQVNELVFVHCNLAITGTGSAGNSLEVRGLPVDINANQAVTGVFLYFNSLTTTRYNGSAVRTGATSLVFLGDWSGGASFGVTPPIAAANGDSLRLNLVYEAA